MDGKQIMANDRQWTPITTALPPLDKEVLFCCLVDDDFTEVRIGTYRGHKTVGAAVVMDEIGDDWSPCSHWMELPKRPEIRAADVADGGR